MAKKTPNAKRLEEEKKLEGASKFGINMRYGNPSALNKLIDGDGYGTSRSAAARKAGNDVSERIYQKEDKTVGEAGDDPRARKAMREAAAEERRESRGFKQGGQVRGYGAARGAKKCKMY
jgi:hypothetical protein